jgi:ATP-dependent Lon protease
MLLKQYEMLQKPLPFRTLPTLEALFMIRDKLKNEFPWADEAVNTVMSELIARRRHGVLRLGMAPVLLAGSPGTGKTRFAQRLSELLETPNLVINLAGMHDNKVLKGVTRGWASNRPSRIVELILQSKLVNPFVILDEIDKTSTDSTRGGSAQDALLDLLEPGNAQRYQDVYLMAECNLSHCLYISTCNSFETISEPLRTRLRPVYFPGPRPEHTPRLIDGIVRDFEKFWGLPSGALTISREQQEKLIGLSAREIKAAVLEMLGSIDEQEASWLH